MCNIYLFITIQQHQFVRSLVRVVTLTMWMTISTVLGPSQPLANTATTSKGQRLAKGVGGLWQESVRYWDHPSPLPTLLHPKVNGWPRWGGGGCARFLCHIYGHGNGRGHTVGKMRKRLMSLATFFERFGCNLQRSLAMVNLEIHIFICLTNFFAVKLIKF